MGKGLQTLPSLSILENLTIVLLSDFDSLQMEEQKAFLTFFRALTEEENEDIMQGDRELNLNLKKNVCMSFEDVLENSGVSLSYVLLPLEGEKIGFNSVGDGTRSKAGDDIDMTDEERNLVNLTEQHNEAVTTENCSENFTTNQESNNSPDECFVKVNGCSNEGCSISPNGCALEETLQAKCQHISSDCTSRDCVCVAPIKLDNTEEAEPSERNQSGSVHCQEDLLTSSPDSHVDEDSTEGRPSKTRHATVTMALIGPEVGEEVEQMVNPTLEQTDFPFSFKNADEEGWKGSGEDSMVERKDAFSSQSRLPCRSKDTSPSISITPATIAQNPPPGSTFTRATFSPGSPTEKQIQLPALFSGLRVLRKGVVGPEHDTVAQIRTSPQRARRDIVPEKQGEAKVQGSFLEQISHFLSREKRGDETEEKGEMETEGGKTKEKTESEDGVRSEVAAEEDAKVSTEPTKPSVSSAEAAFDAFKAFFTPKPLKKDPAEKVDLEAVRKKIRADKDAVKALFERTSIKTTEKKDSPDCQVGILFELASSIKKIVLSCYL